MIDIKKSWITNPKN